MIPLSISVLILLNGKNLLQKIHYFHIVSYIINFKFELKQQYFTALRPKLH